MKRLKILFVATEPASGMIPFAASIINTLSKDERFEIHCLCINSGNKTYTPYIADLRNATFVEYPKQKILKVPYKLWPVKIISQIQHLDHTLQPDVIHFLTGDFSMAGFVLLSSSRWRQKLFYTVHDLNPHEAIFNSRKERILRTLIKGGNRVMRNVIPNITTSSKSQINSLQQMYPLKNVTFTPFPSLVTKSIKDGTNTAIELKGIKNYILFFGNINVYKGVDLLIEAYEDIDCNTKLVIAGNGLDYQTKSKNVIKIHRFIQDDEIANLFRFASFVVYPYRSATMSGVLSIASYFKKSVLLSDVPFFTENADNNCTFFKTGDVNDLKAKLLEMLKNTSMAKHNSYSDQYSSQHLCDSYFNLYNSTNQHATSCNR